MQWHTTGRLNQDEALVVTSFLTSDLFGGFSGRILELSGFEEAD